MAWCRRTYSVGRETIAATLHDGSEVTRELVALVLQKLRQGRMARGKRIQGNAGSSKKTPRRKFAPSRLEDDLNSALLFKHGGGQCAS